jgi:hypothetical protein
VKFDCSCGGGPEFICAKLPENIGMFLLALWLLAGRGRAKCSLSTRRDQSRQGEALSSRDLRT